VEHFTSLSPFQLSVAVSLHTTMIKTPVLANIYFITAQEGGNTTIFLAVPDEKVLVLSNLTQLVPAMLLFLYSC